MPNRQVIAGLGTLAGILAMSLIRRRSKYDLRGKTVLVTGGSRGLGLLLAREFAARGARIAISARDPEELERAADQLRGISSEILSLEADMTMREEAENAIQKVRQQFGSLEVLVNNAGTITVGPVK